jgi:signal transduction histidine kinase
MAGHSIAIRPIFATTLAKVASVSTRHIRLTVILCVIVISGSFAAAGLLQFRLETANANRQAAFFEAKRAQDVAAIVSETLSRQRKIGRQFATGEIFTLPPDVSAIAVSDALGKVSAAIGEPIAMSGIAGLAVDHPAVIGGRGSATVVFRQGIDIIAVRFHPLVPPGVLEHLEIASASGVTIAGTPINGGTIAAAVPSWPLKVLVPREDPDALNAWYGTLPLYLFVILGPALVGAWLAAVFVREFERRAKASEAIRNLRSTRPAEARLLVRLANAERAAIESQRSKSEFVAHMSHELRTPLNAVIGFAEVIERGFYGPVGHKKYIEYAHDIGMAGRALHTKVGDILEFADIEAGRYPLKPERFDLVDVVESCVDESAGRAFSRQITLNLLPSDASPVFADPMAVRRILMNLLSNALTYTPDGGRITVTISEDAGAIAVAVADSGSGFSDSERAAAGKAFRRFQRAGVSTGTGLGLAIVVALARRMGGALRLESEQGHGTSAELRLPKAQDH